MTGSKEACTAWLMLRGPVFLAYMAMLLFSVSERTNRAAGSVLWSVSIVTAMVLVAGSISSYAVVAGWRWKMWMKLELLELTGLRIGVIVASAHGAFAFYRGNTALGFSHVMVAFLMVALLTNRVWKAGERNRGRRV